MYSQAVCAIIKVVVVSIGQVKGCSVSVFAVPRQVPSATFCPRLGRPTAGHVVCSCPTFIPLASSMRRDATPCHGDSPNTPCDKKSSQDDHVYHKK